MNYSDMIEKAKYISRKRVGNRYVYKYADDKKGGKKSPMSDSQKMAVEAQRVNRELYETAYRKYITGKTDKFPMPPSSLSDEQIEKIRLRIDLEEGEKEDQARESERAEFILQKLGATHALMAIADGKDQPVPRTDYQDWDELQEKGLVTRVGKKFFNLPRAPLGLPSLRSSKNRVGGESPKNFKLTALGKKVVAAEKARRNAPYGT